MSPRESVIYYAPQEDGVCRTAERALETEMIKNEAVIMQEQLNSPLPRHKQLSHYCSKLSIQNRLDTKTS